VLLIAPCAAGGRANERIHPDLEPKSDHKFMKHDYPDDQRGGPQYHNFDYPYPTVQDSDRYDQDYTRDENDDNGYWKAQMHYDELKSKLGRDKAGLNNALAKMQQAEKDLAAAKAAEQAAEDAAKAAEIKEKHADGKHDTAEKNLAEVREAIKPATEHVEKEVVDLEECKRQLAEARKKLKVLLEEKVAAQKRREEKKVLEKSAEEIEKEAEIKERELEKSLEEEQSEYKMALKDYNKELEDVKQAEANLQKAAEKLQKFRRADPDGGVYEKASCPGPRIGLPLVLAAAVRLML